MVQPTPLDGFARPGQFIADLNAAADPRNIG
jgi:hypothetical protein